MAAQTLDNGPVIEALESVWNGVRLYRESIGVAVDAISDPFTRQRAEAYLVHASMQLEREGLKKDDAGTLIARAIDNAREEDGSQIEGA